MVSSISCFNNATKVVEIRKIIPQNKRKPRQEEQSNFHWFNESLSTLLPGNVTSPVDSSGNWSGIRMY